MLLVGTSNGFHMGKGCALYPRSINIRFGLGDLFHGRQSNDEEGAKFVKIGGAEDENAFGPPVLLLGGFPKTIETAEVRDMVSDEAPLVWQRGLAVVRVTPAMLDQTLQDVLEETAAKKKTTQLDAAEKDAQEWGVPVIFFSGMGNGAVRRVSRLVLGELYAENGQRGAVARAVPPAMEKSCGQLFGEIVDDHRDILAKMSEQ